MSEIDRGWGVLRESLFKSYGGDMTIRYVATEYAHFYQNNPRLKATRLTRDEAYAMCALFNAGGNDDRENL